MNALFRFVAILACLVCIGVSASAQTQVVVPDLTGLNAPKAAAELNRLGLRLGEQRAEGWSAGAGVAENTIGAQSVAPGTTVDAGTAVDITVLRTPNARLIYDDNDITLVNLTGQAIDISGLRFVTTEGGNASFDASRWSGELRANQCVQLWSLNRNGPKGLPECQAIQNWLTTTNQGSHFWTQTSGARTFEVRQSGSTLTACPAATTAAQNAPLTCEFYVAAGGMGDVAEFVYFAYTLDAFAAINPTNDSWLRLNRATITAPQTAQGPFAAPFRLTDASLFGNPDIVAEFGRLAPQQCLFLFDEAHPEAVPPQPCDVIASLAVPAGQLFWHNDFELDSRDGKTFKCTAAVEGKRTICIMPR